MKKLIMILALAAAVFCSGAEKRGELNSILASVNGVPVSLQDVLAVTRDKEFRARSSSSGAELEKQILDIRRKAVDDLIDRKLIIEDYAGQSFKIPERDIENAVDEIAERMGIRSRAGFEQSLRRQGSSIDEVRKHVRETMIVQLMLHREYMAVRSVTPEKMYSFYKEKIVKKQGSGSVELAMILLDAAGKSRAGMIAKELKKDPARFAELARKWSSGPGSEEGGRLGRIECRLLRPEFAKALVTPEKDKIYGPLETPEGVVFLKVLQYVPPAQVSYRESIPEIRRQLEAEQRHSSRVEYTKRLRKNAIIRYFF